MLHVQILYITYYQYKYLYQITALHEERSLARFGSRSNGIQRLNTDVDDDDASIPLM